LAPNECEEQNGTWVDTSGDGGPDSDFGDDSEVDPFGVQVISIDINASPIVLGNDGGVETFQKAEQELVKQKLNKKKCQTDLGLLGTNTAAIHSAAANANIQDGTNSTVPEASLYANTPNYSNAQTQFGSMTIGQFQAQHPGTVAQAQLNGNNIYVNSSLISASNYWVNLSSALHEDIHNATGLTDSDIQRLLGLSQTEPSVNISNRLLKDCF
jgi:hypothetical protein